MSTQLFKIVFVVSLLFCTVAARSAAQGNLSFSGSPASATIGPRGAFVTTLTVTSSDRSLGAFSTVLQYDSSRVHIQQIAAPAVSAFSGNLFVDTSSFASGSTRVVAFQTNDTSNPNNQAVFQILWKALGAAGQSINTTVSIQPETVVDGTWLNTTVSATTVQIGVNGFDSDGDGIPDWWEVAYGLNPSNFLDASTIAHNGVTNLQSYLTGVDPRGHSAFRSFILPAQHGQFVIQWNSVPGYSYQVYATTDLKNGFAPLSGVIAAGLNETSKSYTDTAANGAKKFYRVIAVP